MAVQVEGATGIGGSPAVVEAAAQAITTAAATMTTAGHDVATHGDAALANWTGDAAGRAHGRIRHLANRTDAGAETVSELPAILTVYAEQLRAAQADYLAGVAAAQTARAALTQAATAVSGAASMDAGPDRAAAMRLSSQAQAFAEEGVAAATHTINAALAREHQANDDAAAAVRTLTTRLADFTDTTPGTAPPSIRATEATQGYHDTGPPPAWIERTAQHVVNAAAGALDTAYIAPQGFGYLFLRNTGYSHEEAMARLESDHDKIRDVFGADTDSPEYRFFDLHDEIEEANAGTDGGGAREVVGAVGEVGWQVVPGAVSAYGRASGDPGLEVLSDVIDDAHDDLEDEWGTDTDTRLYQRSVLVGQMATVFGGPGALRGAGAMARAGREGEEAAAVAASRDGIAQANRDAAHGEALTDDAARTAAASQVAAARASSLEEAASKQMAAKTGRPLEEYGTTPTLPGSAGVAAPTEGRSTPMGPLADAREIIDPIGDGHSYAKHVIKKQEFPGVTDQETYKVVIADVIAHGEVKEIRPDVYAYWKDGIVVVNNPLDPDLGTAFVPDTGYDWFYELDNLLT